MSDKTFFVKIDLPKFKDVIDFLIHNETEISVKLNSHYYKTKLLSQRTPTLFDIVKFSMLNFEREEIICSFEIKNEKYFFKSYIISNEVDHKIEVPTEIFQLQRRNDFRVSLPLGLSYNCELISVNYVKGPYRVELRDVSLGGCQISCPKKVLNLRTKEVYPLKISKDDEVELKIVIHQFEETNIKCIAKHIKNIDSISSLSIGLMFVEPEATFLTELQGLLFYLDRVHRGKGYE